MLSGVVINTDINTPVLKCSLWLFKLIFVFEFPHPVVSNCFGETYSLRTYFSSTSWPWSLRRYCLSKRRMLLTKRQRHIPESFNIYECRTFAFEHRNCARLQKRFVGFLNVFVCSTLCTDHIILKCAWLVHVIPVPFHLALHSVVTNQTGDLQVDKHAR